jgi:hypothetical protein
VRAGLDRDHAGALEAQDDRDRVPERQIHLQVTSREMHPVGFKLERRVARHQQALGSDANARCNVRVGHAPFDQRCGRLRRAKQTVRGPVAVPDGQKSIRETPLPLADPGPCAGDRQMSRGDLVCRRPPAADSSVAIAVGARRRRRMWRAASVMPPASIAAVAEH